MTKRNTSQEVISVSEIIQAPAIAKIVGCDKNKVRYNMKNGFWEFGRVIKTGPKKHRYEATITEVARYIEISREEAIRRLEVQLINVNS
jgi:hypothetical protein